MMLSHFDVPTLKCKATKVRNGQIVVVNWFKRLFAILTLNYSAGAVVRSHFVLKVYYLSLTSRISQRKNYMQHNSQQHFAPHTVPLDDQTG